MCGRLLSAIPKHDYPNMTSTCSADVLFLVHLSDLKKGLQLIKLTQHWTSSSFKHVRPRGGAVAQFAKASIRYIQDPGLILAILVQFWRFLRSTILVAISLFPTQFLSHLRLTKKKTMCHRELSHLSTSPCIFGHFLTFTVWKVA